MYTEHAGKQLNGQFSGYLNEQLKKLQPEPTQISYRYSSSNEVGPVWMDCTCQTTNTTHKHPVYTRAPTLGWGKGKKKWFLHISVVVEAYC